MDHPASLSRDSSVNCAEGEQLRKAKEDKRKKKQRKLQARERGEDTDSDDDGDDDEKVDNIEWDDLENEDVLIGIGLSLQESGPFPFHGGEGTSGEPKEAGHSDDAP